MESAVVLGLCALALPIMFIAIGYYLDYKHDRKGFLKDVKSISIGIISMIAIFILSSFVFNSISALFPINSDYGHAYNDSRLVRGIPVIESSWKVWPLAGDRYEEWWGDTVNTDANHTFKIINYNLWGPVSEQDYFEKEGAGVRLEVIYDYSSDSISYRKIVPKDHAFIQSLGRTAPDFKYETVSFISHTDFKNTLSKWSSN